jgi:glycogen debranching enzyme
VATGTAEGVPGLDEVLAPAGWPYASGLPADADDPGRFHALFGRDSLITALALLPVRPDVAAATLRALAGLLGQRVDPRLDEEPGKVVHEVRVGLSSERAEYLGLDATDGELRYYGSADATPWFLYVLAATGDAALADELEPAWRAAGGWLLGALERGAGLLRWGPRTEAGGLGQQGWRDTVDATSSRSTKGSGILREDGGLPTAPVADADTQAVAVAGLRALAALSGEAGHAEAARALEARVRAAFGPETMALEADDREVPGAGSQLGWLLWAGCAGPGAAERLAAPDVLTPYGLRTLSSEHPRFDPDAYHRGGVWPFDSWLGWGGLRAAGRAADAERVRAGVLGALERLGRFPELYAVVGGEPRRIAFANQVQAWTVGAAWALRHGWDGRVPDLTQPQAPA